MIFCYDFTPKAKYPRFYQPTVELMQKAAGRAFLTREDLDVFFAMLKQRIDHDKPIGHKASVHVHFSRENAGQVSLESGKVDFQIARIHFQPVQQVLEYSYETGDFFPVNLVKEGGAR